MESENRIANSPSSWFGMVPAWACEYVESGKISGVDFAVFCVLCIHASKVKRCFPSLPTIAKESGFSERSVSRSVKKLEESGLIRILLRGNGKGHANLYEIVDLLQRVTVCHPLDSERVTVSPQRVTHSPTKGDTVAYQHTHITDPITEAKLSVSSDEDQSKCERIQKQLDSIRSAFNW